MIFMDPVKLSWLFASGNRNHLDPIVQNEPNTDLLRILTTLGVITESIVLRTGPDAKVLLSSPQVATQLLLASHINRETIQ